MFFLTHQTQQWKHANWINSKAIDIYKDGRDATEKGIDTIKNSLGKNNQKEV